MKNVLGINKMTNGGFGKTILFNEHFVVYGIPAIVSAISDQTTATVELTDDLTPSGAEGSMAGEGFEKEAQLSCMFRPAFQGPVPG